MKHTICGDHFHDCPELPSMISELTRRAVVAEAEVVGLRYKLDHECAALLECQRERQHHGEDYQSACNAIARLTAEVERLRAENAELSRLEVKKASCCADNEAEVKYLRASLAEYVSADAAFAEDHSNCGECEWTLRHQRARAALRGGE